MYYISASDGVRIAVYDYNPKGCKTVVLIHGWPLSHKIYEYQVSLLTECGFRVVAVDLRGFGASDTPVCGYTYDQMAKDVYSVIRAMNLTGFVLVGFSMGGAIALRYMRRFKGYGVKRLILLAAAAPSWTQRPGYPYGKTREEADELIHLAGVNRPELARQFSHEQLFASPQTESVKNWFEGIALSASGIGTVQSAAALRDEDGRDDLLCVKVPTVIIHGAKDTVVSSDLVNIQKAYICNSELITLENSGHAIMYDELGRFNHIFLQTVNEG